MKLFTVTCVIIIQVTHCPASDKLFAGAVPYSLPVGYLTEDILDEVTGKDCRHQVELVRDGVQNFTIWALKLWDATAKPPSGLLRGNLRVLGDLDACLTLGAEAPVKGKYCLANVALTAHDPRWEPLLDIATSGRRRVEITRNREELGPSIFPTTARVEWGVCAPSACSSADVEALLAAVARRPLAASRLSASVHVSAHACQDHLGSARALAPADYAFISVLVAIISLVAIATTYEIYNMDKISKNPRLWKNMLCAFSLRVNWQRMAENKPSGKIGCIDGVRAISTIWVVLTHKSFQFAGEPWLNKKDLFQIPEVFAKMPLVNSMLNVDTFFMISGMLRTYTVTDELKEDKFNYVQSLVKRFIRLSPPYFLVVWFYATLFEFVGSGPMWQENIGNMVEICQKNWIFNVLYINNYISHAKFCMLQSWYVSADIQLFALSPLILIPLWKWRAIQKKLMAGLLALSIVIPAAVIYFWNLPGFFVLNLTDKQMLDYKQYVYVPTHARMSSYLVGVALGSIFSHLKERKFNMSRAQAALGWLLASVTLVAVVFGPFPIMQVSHPFHIAEHVLYGATHRVLWALAVAWMVFACHVGHGGLVDRILNCYTLRVLSRLSYCVYLCHFAVLLVNSARMRTPLWGDDYLLFQSLIAEYIISLVFAMLLFLTVESPVWFLLRIFPSKHNTIETDKVQIRTTTDESTASLVSSSDGMKIKTT